MKRGVGELALGVLAHGFAWFAATEEIWFPLVGAYIRFVQPEMAGLPDLRGPFLALSLCYIGLRIGDLWNKREEINDTL